MIDYKGWENSGICVKLSLFLFFVGPLTCKRGTSGTSVDQACEDVKYKSCLIEVKSSKY